MKKSIILFGLIVLVLLEIQAQSNDNAEALNLSHRIAKKIKDSLDLSALQRQEIYQVNMDLYNQKQAIRLQNPPVDSLQPRIQRIENKRDALYLPIIGNEKYQLYLQKKGNLVNNN